MNHFVDMCIFSIIVGLSVQAFFKISFKIKNKLEKKCKKKHKYIRNIIEKLDIETIIKEKTHFQNSSPLLKITPNKQNNLNSNSSNSSNSDESNKTVIYDNSDESDNNPMTPVTPPVPSPTHIKPIYLDNFQDDLSLSSSSESIDEVNIRKSRRLQNLKPTFEGLL